MPTASASFSAARYLCLALTSRRMMTGKVSLETAVRSRAARRVVSITCRFADPVNLWFSCGLQPHTHACHARSVCVCVPGKGPQRTITACGWLVLPEKQAAPSAARKGAQLLQRQADEHAARLCGSDILATSVALTSWRPCGRAPLTPLGKSMAGATVAWAETLHERRTSSCATTKVDTRHGAEASKAKLMPSTPGVLVGSSASVCFLRLT
jgi:hypothetical protein